MRIEFSGFWDQGRSRQGHGARGAGRGDAGRIRGPGNDCGSGFGVSGQGFEHHGLAVRLNFKSF